MSGVEADTIKPHRVEWLDGLRAYAIAGVMAIHVGQIALLHRSSKQDQRLGYLFGLGQYGVQLFFVISAVTVYLTLGRYEFSWGRFRTWLTKRFFRIAPLYYCSIPFFYASVRLLNATRAAADRPFTEVFTRGDLLANLLFVNTWFPHANNNVVQGGWSIGVEMMFYLLAPLIFNAIRSRALAFVFYTVLALAGLGLTVMFFGPAGNNEYAYFWLPTQLPALLSGAALCRLSAEWLTTSKPAPRLAPAWALVVGTCALLLISVRGSFGVWHYTVAPLVAGVLFCCTLVLAKSWWHAAFDNSFAVAIGRLSFSIYLVHFLVLGLFRFLLEPTPFFQHSPVLYRFVGLYVATSLVTVGLSYGTRWAIEDRGNEWGRLLAKRAA